MEILQTFGIKPILLAAQAVNFIILLLILKRFLYKPILKVLDERKQKIAQSLKDAEEIEKRLEQITREREKRLDEAAKEAKGIISDATDGGNKIIKQAHEKAAKDIEKMVEKAQKSMELERDGLHREIRAELGDIVAAALERVANKTLTEKDKKELVERSVKGML